MNLLRSIVCGSAVFVAACGSAPLPKPPNDPPPPAAASGAAPAASAPNAPAPAASEPETTGPGVALCDVVCERAFVDPGSQGDGAEDVARATENANRVLDGMKPDLLACYENRIRAKPQAHAFMTLSILVGNDGKVKDVETTGGALLGDRAIRCIADRVRRGSFEPPRGRGTVRIELPFTLRRLAAGE